MDSQVIPVLLPCLLLAVFRVLWKDWHWSHIRHSCWIRANQCRGVHHFSNSNHFFKKPQLNNDIPLVWVLIFTNARQVQCCQSRQGQALRHFSIGWVEYTVISDLVSSTAFNCVPSTLTVTSAQSPNSPGWIPFLWEPQNLRTRWFCLASA